MTNRLTVQSRLGKTFGLWLAALCIGILLSLLFVPGHVSADEVWLPPWAVAQWQPSARPWDIRQELIVEIEVNVRDAGDVALLRSMGYSCAVGVCTVELRDGEEVVLSQLGISVRAIARAVKVSGHSRRLAFSASSVDEPYVYGFNNSPLSTSFGGCTLIDIATAPTSAVVRRNVVTALVTHPRVSDIQIYLMGDAGYFWDRQGGYTDGGFDDDQEDDSDVYLSNRETTAFAGQPVNDGWYLCYQDDVEGYVGTLEWWSMYVFYCYPPLVPWSQSPANGATQVALNRDLDWSADPLTQSYDVYFGTTNPPPLHGWVTANTYPLPTLSCGTHYYWKVGAWNDCGYAESAVWDFSTIAVPTQPSAPSPAHDASNQSLDVDLDWADVPGAASYDVYFGTNSLFKGGPVGNTMVSNYALGTLSCGQHYYWKIVAKNDCGENSSAVWEFTTTCTLAAPSLPSPAHNATSQPLDVELNWSDVPGATSYDVYLATIYPFKGGPAGTTTSSYFEPGTLSCNQHYYWQVVAKCSCGETSSSVWEFDTTCCLPGTPSNPSPANGATNQPSVVDLDWADADGATSYDVYFGTSSSPPKVGTSTVSSFALGSVDEGTHYYWKVVAKNSCGDTPGPLWQFATQGPEPTPTNTPVETPAGRPPVCTRVQPSAREVTYVTWGQAYDLDFQANAEDPDCNLTRNLWFRDGNTILDLAATGCSHLQQVMLSSYPAGTYHLESVFFDATGLSCSVDWLLTVLSATPTATAYATPTRMPTSTSTATVTPGDSFTLQRWASRQADWIEGMLWFDGDFEGNGKEDLAVTWNNAGMISIDVYASTGTAFSKQRWATQQGAVMDGMLWFPGDFNGDGRLDLATLWNSGGKISIDVHVSTGSAFTLQRWATQAGDWIADMLWFVGDFDGAGRDDLAVTWNDAGMITIDVYSSTGSAFGKQRWATQQGSMMPDTLWFAGDFDGDGRDDLADLWSSSGYICIDVHASTGTAFTLQRWATGQGAVMPGIVWLVGDFNGDGRDDLADKWNSDGRITIDVHASTGSAFTLERWGTQQGDVIEGMLWFTGDFDGNGKDDLAVRWDHAGMNSIDVYASTGAGFTRQHWATRQGNVTVDMLWFPGDFSGDGRDDLAVRWNDAGKITIDVFVAQATSAPTPTSTPPHTPTSTPTRTPTGTAPAATATLLPTPTSTSGIPSIWKIHLPILLRRQ